VLIGRRRLEGERGVRRAGRQRGERIAGRRFFRGLAAQVDQAAAIGMLQRMQQRRLPAGEQRRGKDQPCEQFS
jgi:hypothetical protein